MYGLLGQENIWRYSYLISGKILINKNFEKITFMTNHSLSFEIFTVGTLQYISMEQDLYLIS